jgi:hypothetical protein
MDQVLRHFETSGQHCTLSLHLVQNHHSKGAIVMFKKEGERKDIHPF